METPLEGKNDRVPVKIKKKKSGGTSSTVRKTIQYGILVAAGFITSCDKEEPASQILSPAPISTQPVQTSIIPAKSPTELKREKEIAENTPDAEEIKLFKQALQVTGNQYVTRYYGTEEKICETHGSWTKENWLTEEIKDRLAEGFARLAKTAKLNDKQKRALSKRLQNIMTTTTLCYYENGVMPYGNTDDGYIILIDATEKDGTGRKRLEIPYTLFHELVHRLEHSNVQAGSDGYHGLYRVYNEGIAEISMQIAFPESNRFNHAYTENILLVSALGIDFYLEYLKDHAHAAQNIKISPQTYQFASNSLLKYIEKFCRKWKITMNEKNLKTLKNIFMPDGRDFKTHDNLTNLKKILEENDIKWHEFLESIAPPNNHIVDNWLSEKI